MSVTVWSKPACVQCTAVKRWLKKRGIEYHEANLLDDPGVLAAFKAAGYLQAPIVEVTGFMPFSGFDVAALHERFPDVEP